MMQSHEDVITKANRLLTGLRTSPAAILGRRSRSKKKRRRPSFVEKELYKNLVLIEFLGHSPPEVQDFMTIINFIMRGHLASLCL